MPTVVSPWGNALQMLAAAGVEEDASYYREFTGEDEKAVLTVAMRIQAAWATNDAGVFADIFTENGSLLMQDDQLQGREQIRSYMTTGFEGPYRGARVQGWPVAVKFLSDDVSIVITEGGILLGGETELVPERLIRATWVIVKQEDGHLKLLSHQSSPVNG